MIRRYRKFWYRNGEFRLALHEIRAYKTARVYQYNGLALRSDTLFIVMIEMNCTKLLRNAGWACWRVSCQVPFMNVPHQFPAPIGAFVTYRKALTKLESAIRHRPDMYKNYDNSHK